MIPDSHNFVEYVLSIWTGGGSLMIPLALLALLLYFCMFELYDFVRRYNFPSIDENEWKHWIKQPEDSDQSLTDIIRYVKTDCPAPNEIHGRFRELMMEFIRPIDRRIAFVGILIGVAPLTGLLGTVVGMLATFHGLSSGAGGDTVDLVAGGISQALITTQTGLVIAIPAYVLLSKIRNKRNELETFFLKMEIETINVCTKT